MTASFDPGVQISSPAIDYWLAVQCKCAVTVNWFPSTKDGVSVAPAALPLLLLLLRPLPDPVPSSSPLGRLDKDCNWMLELSAPGEAKRYDLLCWCNRDTERQKQMNWKNGTAEGQVTGGHQEKCRDQRKRGGRTSIPFPLPLDPPKRDYFVI